ncbi:MAG: NADP-dependent malic enzyme [Deltaproteobacteria bacterium]|nr:NADP-dependent malic enzyme [Deltaproteobacteria bacterium]
MSRTNDVTRESLLKKAEKPSKDAMKFHPFYKGKLQVMPKCPIRSSDDWAIWYTPGVAAPCKDIEANPEKVFDYTNKGNTVAVVSDGTRVLGLGDIGPEAGLPVMEGKAILFKYLGGVDAFPLCLDTKDPDELIKTVLLLQPSFGGVNLEDISQPKCFKVLDTLRQEARIPIWHDDQQGTAAVTLAGLINALKLVGKDISQIKVTMVGSGAANIAIARLLIKAGVDPKLMLLVDSKGILHRDRRDRQTIMENFHEKWKFCELTNPDCKSGGIAEAMNGADVTISLSKPGPGFIKQEWIASMARDSIVFTCANPVPEIWPWEAKEAGARIVATGRSDFPNQVNNSLGFPGIFRGTLDVRARTITDEMCIAAAEELAACAADRGMTEDHLIPTMDEWEVYPREAAAVGAKAVEQGVAGIPLAKEEIYNIAEEKIRKARKDLEVLVDAGLIPMPPE